ncbi:hypothetical protein [Bradyrhizobium sp. CCGB01]|uniref:hypothetical protein n=1 Tax=Bradyrhizobium sp. CCGB01 TaxID=2949634 RepID=UPI0020B3E73F|nr:hypothetical protein [Bradyrhizobium sp. CCGB01]MCP3411362.1 hypothetical protein [Bradyrhizobium sp. CCGB01]
MIVPLSVVQLATGAALTGKRQAGQLVIAGRLTISSSLNSVSLPTDLIQVEVRSGHDKDQRMKRSRFSEEMGYSVPIT